MRTIVVDDEAIMIRSFLRISEGIEGIDIINTFDFPEDAITFCENEKVDLAFLDIKMPGMSGIELAKRLREIRPDMLIVFVSAFDEYLRDANEIGADYYILKPYTKETLEKTINKMTILSKNQKRDVYVQMFGRFIVFKKGTPVKLNGKAKEILALVASRHGKEISNEEIYSTIWEDRTYSNVNMKVYYNAIKRLKTSLEEQGIRDILISTTRGQIFNVDYVDCDYFAWLNKTADEKEQFEGEFLSEYSWAEYRLGTLMKEI